MKNLDCRRFALRIMKLSCALMMTVAFGLCWYLAYAKTILTPFYRRGNWLVILIFTVLYIVFAKIYEAFQVSTVRVSEIVYSQCLSLIISNSIMYLVICLLTRHLPNPLPLLALLGIQGILSVVWAWLVSTWYFRSHAPMRTAIVYDEWKDISLLIQKHGLEKKFEIIEKVKVSECGGDFTVLQDMEAVFLCGIHSHARNQILKYCVARNIRVYLLPRIGDTILSGARRSHLLHLPILQVDRYNPSMEFLFTKRLFDVVSSAAMLIVASPIMILTAIAIKVTDGGPVFYCQRRLTKDGKIFNVLKFRSMRVDAEKDGVAQLSTGEKDNRITPVGRVIRKLRIDELPQLLNILNGDMSVVGPRPERPEIAAEYAKTLPEFDLRLQAKAGLTGYAQVYGKYNTTPYDKLKMDLLYISRPSFLEDLRIVFATIKILFVPESTEGFETGQAVMSEHAAEEPQVNRRKLVPEQNFVSMK